MYSKRFRSVSLLIVVVLLLAACAPQVVKETVIVTEKEVVKETVVVTEKEVVKETVIVTEEKVVEVTPVPVGLPEFDPNKKVTIVVAQPSGWYTEAAIEAFMKKYPNVTVEIGQPQDASQDEAAFLTRAATGDVDDVFGGGDESPDMYGPRGIYIDLKPWLERDADLWYNAEKFTPWLTYENPDGAIYSVPIGGNPMLVVYNKAMLDAAGLEYPPERYDDPAYDQWTWDKFQEYAIALTDPANDVWGVGIENNILVYWPFVYSNGARMVNDDLTDYLIDDPKVVETFEFLTGLVLDGYAPDPASAQEMGGMGNLFTGGQVAMYVVGGWMVGGAWSNAIEDFGFDIGLAALPYKTTNEGIVLCPAMRQGISSFTEHPEVCYEWLKFLYFESDDLILAADWSPWQSQIPRHDLFAQRVADGSIVHGAWGPNNDQDVEFLLTNHGFPPYVMSDPPWNGPFPETRDITLAELSLVYSGEQTLDEAVANINSQADMVMLLWQRGK